MVIKIINYSCNDVVNISLPVILGEVIPGKDSIIHVQNISFQSNATIWPVINGRFKVLVHLKEGPNQLKFEHKNSIFIFNLNYSLLCNEKFVRLVYIKCKDDVGSFQAPPGENNTIQSACDRICLAGQMIQTFTYDKMEEHGLSKKTFKLEERNDKVICHVFTSSLTLTEAYSLNQEELWSHFAVELMNSSLRISNNCKFLAFLSFTRYVNNSGSIPQTHQEIIRMTKGYTALGGGGLALFGSACLHTWPQTVQEIPWRFGDRRQINKLEFMDDSANRGYHWACYSTGLGATLHELGHTFDLGHTHGGIMGRGFDDINKYFIIDMFYHDHIYQRQYNPYFLKPSNCEYTVSLCLTSPTLSEEPIEETVKHLSLSNNETVPLKLPHPPNSSCNNIESSKCPVSVGGAYWCRASALILYFHKWFNSIDAENSGRISLEGTKLSSQNGIKVMEFKDLDGMSLHHLDFLEDNEVCDIDLTLCDISDYLPAGVDEILFIAEDECGNIIKSKLNVDIFLKR